MEPPCACVEGQRRWVPDALLTALCCPHDLWFVVRQWWDGSIGAAARVARGPPPLPPLAG